jgi:hypothetical protein
MLFRLLLILMLKNKMGEESAQSTLLKDNFCQLTKIFALSCIILPQISLEKRKIKRNVG